MEKIKATVNAEYNPGDKPGGFLQITIKIQEGLEGLERDHAIRQAILDKLRFTIEKD